MPDFPSPQDLYEEHKSQPNYTGLLHFAWIVIFFNGAVIITFYIFPKQRVFPLSVQAWTLVLDIVYYIRELAKWGPYSNLSAYLLWFATPATCRILYTWQGFMESGQALCDVYLAFIMYCIIVKKIDMSYQVNPRFFWLMVGLFWIYTITWALVFGVAPTFNPRPNAITCAPTKNEYNYAMVGQWLLALCIELYFLGHCFRYVKAVWNATQQGFSKKDHRTLLLCLRFGCIMFLHIIPRVMWNIQQSGFGLTNTNYSLSIHSITFGFYIIDGFVLLFTNRCLKKWLRKKYTQITHVALSVSSDSDEQQREQQLQQLHSSQNREASQGDLSMALDSSINIDVS